MKKMLCIVAVILTLISTVSAEIVAVPAYPVMDENLVTYDAERDVFVDHYKFYNDWWMSQEIRERLDNQRDIPAKHSLKLSLRSDLWQQKEKVAYAGVMFLVTQQKAKRRFVMINVEQSINEITNDDTTRYRVWPHLGLLFVGTAASEENYEVILWDELIQGYAPLEQLIQPGDIVGLSLVVTGIERGVILAEQAKKLGARLVIAGNDSAIFRANQLLALPGKPIDAVFTSNSLNAVREFFYQIGDRDCSEISVAGVQTASGGIQKSNEQSFLKQELSRLAKERKVDPAKFDHDAFVVPNLNLFPASYWKTVQSNYRTTYGHRFSDPAIINNASALLAQGCTRTRGSEVCRYCSIAGVADIRIPEHQYLLNTVEKYREFGINTVYNVTDSVYEMAPAIARPLRGIDPFNALFLYGRAQGVAQHPELLDDWLSLVTERLTINMGQDSGDERILAKSIGKSSAVSGSRINENSLAIEHIKTSGANLHGSFIFGSPGETSETCERTLDYADWVQQTLGRQCETLESDVFWLNFGAPASQVFHDYDYAVHLAGLAGKEISQTSWKNDFWDQKEKLSVPKKTEQAWYHHFTNISYEEAQEYVMRIDKMMSVVDGSIPARGFNPGGVKRNPNLPT